MTILCNRRRCDNPATVDVYTDGGYIDEHVCDEHAKEGINGRVTKIRSFVRRADKKPLVTLTVEWTS